jgi:hypothetical protein
MINYCRKYYRALPHSIILVKLQRGIMTAASLNKWPTNVVPYVLENAFTAADCATNKSMLLFCLLLTATLLF